MPTLFGFYARPLPAERTERQSSCRRMALLIPVILALAAGPAALADEALLNDVKATAIIESCADEPKFLGVATVREEASEEGIKQVSVVIQITERNRVLPPGKHAVHIHEFGQCEPTCTDAGGHFDPGPFGFSSPDGNHPYHAGDLVNLGISTTGQGFLRTDTSRVTLSPGPLSVFDEDGSAIIVHVDPDTYCPEGEAAGCAGGARAACGVLELAD
jgi:Cu-Zn family superoxide dismutase